MTLTLDGSTSPTLRLLVHLIGRRSSPTIDGTPPTPDELAWLLRAATTVPDHGSLQPWRFVVVSGGERHQFANALAADFVEARGETSSSVLDKVRTKAFAAPTLIVLIASPKEGSTVPQWEQSASAACCGYAIVLVAHALGLGAIWKSTPFRDGSNIRALCRLEEAEQLLGWVNVGAKSDDDAIALRPVPDLSVIASQLTPEGPRPYEGPY